ncbi:MAG TPA: tetratricopeptide repeat protein, partial [Burkholderiaceae bacterium]
SDPDLAGPHANLGLLLLRREDRLPEATTELERATTLAPREPAAWTALGVAYRRAGKFTQAGDAYRHALAVAPDDADAVLDLGILDDLYLGDAAQGLALYTRYLALRPAGDPAVAKWVADLKNRHVGTTAPAASAPAGAAPKEKP